MRDVEMCDGRLTVTGLKTLLDRYVDPDHTLVFRTAQEAYATLGDPRVNGRHFMALDRVEPVDQDTDLVDMDRVAALVREAGLSATVEMTGGNVATLYVGDPVPSWINDEDFERYPAMAGPGTYGWGAIVSTASIHEFFIGPDDDGQSSPLDAHEVGATTEEQIATLLVAQAQRVVRLLDEETDEPLLLAPDEVAALGFNLPPQ